MVATVPQPTVVVTEPFPVNQFHQVYQWSQPYWGQIHDDSVPRGYPDWLAVQLARAAMPGVRTWGVWRGGELGGIIWVTVDDWIARPHVVFKRAFWGSATTLEAWRQVQTVLFAAGIIKIEVWMSADNRLARGIARRAGGRLEGVLTSQGKRDGKLVDCAVYGIYRKDSNE